MQYKKLFHTAGGTLILVFAIYIYSFLSGTRPPLSNVYSVYLGDFSIGFCSKLLIGEILSWFRSSFTKEWVTEFLLISTFVIIFLFSAFLCNAYFSSDKKMRNMLILFFFIFVALPFSITVYNNDFFSFPDIFLLPLLVVTSFTGNKRIISFILPFILASGILIHDCFIFSYMSPCLGIIAYYALKNEKNKKITSTVFVLSSASCIIMSVYSVFFSINTVKMTYIEMFEYITKKGNCTISDVIGYLEYYMYRPDSPNILDSSQIDLMGFFKGLLEYVLDKPTQEEIPTIIFIVPFICIFLYIWSCCIKKSQGFSEKLPYILFALTLLPQVFSTIVSGDLTRFFAPMIITQITYIFICAKQHDNTFTEVMTKLSKKSFYASVLLIILFANLF